MTSTRRTVRHLAGVEWSHASNGWTCTDQTTWNNVHTLRRKNGAWSIDGSPLAASSFHDAAIEAAWTLDYYRPTTAFDPPRVPLRKRNGRTAAELLKEAYAR